MHRTKEKEFLLLPTPRVADVEGGVSPNVQLKNGRFYRKNKKGREMGGKIAGRGREQFFEKAEQIRDFKDFPTQSPFCSRDDGLSCRLDGITVQKLRKESIKAYGNAICVPVAVRIFDTINKYENICS